MINIYIVHFSKYCVKNATILIALVISVTALLAFSSTNIVFQYVNAFVKITSPTKDEAVPVGSDLQITGTSQDTATTDCTISIIVNSQYPYQQTQATGPAGPNDYSQWSFTLSPGYATLKAGTNEIVSKASCAEPLLDLVADEKGNYVGHYSVNVTGVSGTGGTAQSGIDE